LFSSFGFKKQDVGNPYMYFSSINPLRPNINRRILLSDLNTFSDLSISLENLLEDQSKFHLVTILLIVITFSVDEVVKFAFNLIIILFLSYNRATVTVSTAA